MITIKGENLTVFEDLKYEIRKLYVDFKILLCAQMDGEYEKYSNELQALLWDKVSALEIFSADFSTFFDSVMSAQEMNTKQD